jgi:hypothetical protein
VTENKVAVSPIVRFLRGSKNSLTAEGAEGAEETIKGSDFTGGAISSVKSERPFFLNFPIVNFSALFLVSSASSASSAPSAVQFPLFF